MNGSMVKKNKQNLWGKKRNLRSHKLDRKKLFFRQLLGEIEAEVNMNVED